MKCQSLALACLVAMLFLIVSVSAESSNETNFNVNKTICEYSYYFIINHLTTGNIFVYKDEDVLIVKESLLTEKKINITNESFIIDFIENYESICKNETPLLTLPPTVLDVKSFNVSTGGEFFCDSNINKTFLGFFNLDWKIPLPKIHKGQIDCDSTQFFKWFFNYEKTGRYDYSLDGLKLWWIIMSVIILLLFGYYKVNKRINQMIEKEGGYG